MKSLVLGCLMVTAAASAASAASDEIPYDPKLQGQTVACTDFKHGADGSWTALHALAIQRQNEFTTVAADSSFRAGGQKTVGMDVGAMLDAACPH